VDRHPVSGRDAPVHLYGRERGHEPAAEARRFDEVDLLRQAHEVELGARHDDVLGERTPRRESHLVVVVADLRVPVAARLAVPATAAERRGHVLAGLEPAGVRADLRHHARELVPGHVRQVDIGVVAHPPVPVAAADARGRHGHDDSVARRGRHARSLAE
jgi:hypothetical protein